MGLSEHWIAVRVPAASSAAGSSGIEEAGLSVIGERQGWIWARGWPEATGTDDIVIQTARVTEEPCIGAWVYDSDFGYVVGAASDGAIEFQLANKEPYGEEDDFSRWTTRDDPLGPTNDPRRRARTLPSGPPHRTATVTETPGRPAVGVA